MRLQDWPSLLDDFIESRRFTPFAWAVNDCCAFAAEWRRIATGDDFAGDLRAHYTTAVGAARLARRMKRNSHGDPFGALRWPLLAGLLEIRPTFASRGDIAAVPMGERAVSLGVVLGGYIAGPGKNGVEFINVSRALKVWRI